MSKFDQNVGEEVPVFTVANVPTPSATVSVKTHVVMISNGAAGSAILAFWDGSNWKRSDTGATISAS